MTSEISSRVVGVLGGMGPAATADFFAKLTAATPAENDQDHLHVVVWSDPSVPSRQDAVLSNGTDPSPWLERGFDALIAAGAQVLVVPCNTVQPFAAAAVPEGRGYIDIVDVAIAAAARATEASVVGVLATNAALKIGLYQDALAEAGLTALLPGPEEQELLTAIVERVKTTGVDTTTSDQFGALLDAIASCGVDTVIVGCTELSAVLAAGDPASLLRLIDPAHELAVAAVTAARSGVPTTGSLATS